MARNYKCDECGTKMRFDGVSWYTCPDCGYSFRDNGDGSITTEAEIFNRKGSLDVSPEQWRDFEDGYRP